MSNKEKKSYLVYLANVRLYDIKNKLYDELDSFEKLELSYHLKFLKLGLSLRKGLNFYKMTTKGNW